MTDALAHSAGGKKKKKKEEYKDKVHETLKVLLFFLAMNIRETTREHRESWQKLIIYSGRASIRLRYNKMGKSTE